jgi:hypothetical protein
MVLSVVLFCRRIQSFAGPAREPRVAGGPEGKFLALLLFVYWSDLAWRRTAGRYEAALNHYGRGSPSIRPFLLHLQEHPAPLRSLR